MVECSFMNYVVVGLSPVALTETLSLKTIIKELDFLKKTVIVQWNAWKKVTVACEQIKRKIPDPRNATKTLSIFYKR